MEPRGPGETVFKNPRIGLDVRSTLARAIWLWVWPCEVADLVTGGTHQKPLEKPTRRTHDYTSRQAQQNTMRTGKLTLSSATLVVW